MNQCAITSEYNCSLPTLTSAHNRKNYTKQECSFSEYSEDLDRSDQLSVPDIWQKFPLPLSFLEDMHSVSEECRNATKLFSAGLRNMDMQYLKMFDATAKLPSGLLSGNINQYGDYDECLSISNSRYCLTELDINPLWIRTGYKDVADLMHSHYFIKSKFEDPGHRIPSFTMVRWGICIPSACTPNDLQKGLEDKIGIKARVDPAMCSTPNEKANMPYTFGDYFARCFFATLVTLITIASGLCLWQPQSTWRESKSGKLLYAFAIQENWRRLIDTDEDNNKELRAVNGIRCLSAFGLLLCHKHMAGNYNPYINRTEMTEAMGKYWTIIGRTAIVYTDSFLLLSGLLNARSLLSSLKKDGSLHFKDKLITRIFRITPNIITVILFCTYILPNLGSGPLWPLVVDHHSGLCKNYMWRNLLYIHNYFGFENMCLTHTHQVGIDMQLFLVTPLIVYLLWTNKYLGLWCIGILSVASTLLRFFVTYYKNLSPIVYSGISVSQAFDSANLFYTLPTHRTTIYFMGILMALLLETPTAEKTAKKLTKLRALICWIVGLSLGFLALLGGPYSLMNLKFVYNKLDASFYSALSPIYWGLCMIWVSFAANTGFAGWFGDFLSWKGFKILTRLSYSFYLTQFPIFFYNVGAQRNAFYYKMHLMFEISEVGAIFFFSILLTLAVELPFQRIKQILFVTSAKQRNVDIKRIKLNKNPISMRIKQG